MELGSRPVGELTSQQFQQQLNQWFEQNGILDNLRSHLRSLMITALQQTEIGLKPSHKSSPKAQSVNLLVAEYLLKRGCHYTLSVLMSEVPCLANFGSGPVVLHCGPRSLAKNRAGGKYHFQESEILEILNSLGLSSGEDQVRNVTENYAKNKEEESLLECLLGFLSKFQLRQNFVRFEADCRSRLSKEWFEQVAELLLEAKNKAFPLTAVQELLSRITETEVTRMAAEESNRQMELLIEREKRIQKHLKSHEQEMLERLELAEKELNARREVIDKELTERQLHLGRIAFHWKDKHSEILALSKNFAGLKEENVTLQDTVQRLETEANALKAEIKAKTEIIERLETEKASLKSRIQECLKIKDLRDTRREVKASAVRDKCLSAGEPMLKDADLANEANDDLPSSESSSLADEVVLTKAKARLQMLEDEYCRISANYSKYRKKYEDNFGFEPQDVASFLTPRSVTKEPTHWPVPDAAVVAEAEKEKEKEKDDCESNERRTQGSVIEDVPVQVPVKSRQVQEEGQPTRKTPEQEAESMTPTKRQQKNHEYYLESRNLLEILEKNAGFVEAYVSESISDFSLAMSSCNDISKRESENSKLEHLGRERADGGLLLQTELDREKINNDDQEEEEEEEEEEQQQQHMEEGGSTLRTDLNNIDCLMLLKESTFFDKAREEEVEEKREAVACKD